MNISQVLSARLRAADEARSESLLTEQTLSQQISELQTEKDQLLEAQRLREQSSNFLVHDLRSPLSLVTGAINVLEMVLPEDILQANRQIFDLANINCQRMNRMIDSLLDIARLEAGETQLWLTSVNLLDLVKNVTDRMTASVESKSLTLHTVLPAELPLIKADEEKIDRIIANLIDNAIKFTSNGGRITLAVELQTEQVLISVTNTGPTILAEDRQRIFDRFTQISENSLRRRGYGLGLAFCRLAVEAHGGQIWVEPGEGGDGNRFIFTIPLESQILHSLIILDNNR
jgi:signal transduction histidine kinase